MARWAASCPRWIIFDRQRRFCLPMYVRFAAKARPGSGATHGSAIRDVALCTGEYFDQVGFLSGGGDRGLSLDD